MVHHLRQSLSPSRERQSLADGSRPPGLEGSGKVNEILEPLGYPVINDCNVVCRCVDGDEALSDSLLI